MTENNDSNNDQNDDVFSVTHEELDEIRERAVKEARTKRHTWVQKGIHIVCKSCPFQHAFYIGVNKMLVGIDNQGNPIFKNRDEV